MQNKQPIVNGLVLAGGKSTRMRRDKSAIKWHGKEQQYYIADLLKSVCEEVFISCRADQEVQVPYKKIIDAYDFGGPICGILSAFQQDKEVAWLVVACDLPLIDKATLQQLITERNPSMMATAFISSFDGMPEPLIAIWEPSSFILLNNAFLEGKKCPRKILINNNPKLVQPGKSDALLNANTPEDAEKVDAILNKKKGQFIE